MKVIRAKAEYRDMLVSTVLCCVVQVGLGGGRSFLIYKSKIATVGKGIAETLSSSRRRPTFPYLNIGVSTEFVDRRSKAHLAVQCPPTFK